MLKGIGTLYAKAAKKPFLLGGGGLRGTYAYINIILIICYLDMAIIRS
jgi:hypothetical protein